MDPLQSLQDLAGQQSAQLSLWPFVGKLFLAALLGWALSRLYVRFGRSLSDRASFGNNFALLAMTTFLIMSVVKSSIALSLGLVGALSIVRFRAAIKEPEELAFLFLTIAIGLGLGGDQVAATLVAFTVIVGVLWIRYRFDGPAQADTQNLYLTVAGPSTLTLSAIVDVLKHHGSSVDLKRFDAEPARLEAAFLVQFDGLANLEAGTTALRALHEEVRVQYLDDRGVGLLE
ncbi:MAG: DUF4956 domain-containing protein [Bacteroidota bacterium]